MQDSLSPRIHDIHIEDEMSTSYIDYSMSVIVGRALPDVRDGLKPVHRRVLFAMRELGNTHNRPYKKSARVVGDVIGKYHPHGDQAVYDTIVRLAQNFSMRYPLVNGQGNFGSIDGDPPAAMRYTEVRMHRMAEEMLEDLDKDTVDFGPNYDETLEQPLVLPARLPNLLLNGSTGIAVGMATNVPPHNLRELVAASIHLIDNPECSVDDLMQFVKGPDFPTGANILGTRQIEAMYKLGKGRLLVRGVAEVEEHKNRDVILIRELPYTVNKANLMANIARLVNEKIIEGISDLRDESSGQGIRIVIELKRGAFAQVVLNNLYKHTQLQVTFGANMLALDQGRPRVMTLKQMLRRYLDHRFDVITRRTRFELKRAEARLHILEGLRIALDNLDEVVRTIRAAAHRVEAHATLMSRFGLSKPQTDAILEMRLYQLTGLERDKVEEEYRRVSEQIDYLKGLLAHPERIYGIIREDLEKVGADYGDERRTHIVPIEDEVNLEDLIADEPCVVTLSHGGYIKRVPLDTYREQRRGGRGISAMSTKDDDFVEKLFVCATHDTLLFFTTDGRVYSKRAFEVPEAPRTSRGKAIVNMLELRPGETIAALLRIREFSEARHLVMATRQGTVKKSPLSDYKNIHRGGLIGIRINEDDRLIAVRLTGGDDELILLTAQGMSVRFHERDIRCMGRVAHGVRGIRLKEGDWVCSMDVVREDATYLICTANGFGKRSPFDAYRRQHRGGKGIMAIRRSKRNGEVVAGYAVRDGDQLMMVTANGMLVRTGLDAIREVGRGTQGVRLIRLQEGDALVSVSLVPSEEAADKAAEDAAEENAEPRPETGDSAREEPDHPEEENDAS